MSRHRLVKTMDLDDELDDFDGGEDYDNGEEEGTLLIPISPTWLIHSRDK